VRKFAGRARTKRFELHKASICQRDGWRCGLCNKPVNRRKRHPHPLAPSIDHIIPLAKGGTNDLTNLQLAHLHCNLEKRAAARGEQLRLIP
jgi:5-methylcytosine-specific restriction endonuclease McrA